jgi:L-ascorbate metabolism protein UlaG (beta-lactamase superfamily)
MPLFARISALGVLAAAGLVAGPVQSQPAAQGSRCLAMAQAAPATMQVAYVPLRASPRPATPAQSTAGDTTIRFIGHSTFLITSPGGVTIATDYNGSYRPAVPPRIATMNRAHRTHWTPTPDPGIEHVLRGWTDEGVPAAHNLQVDDVLVRNVTTDIRGGAIGRVPDGNSIFIFETGNLCIGHLGHLHQVLEGADLGWIGQLDVVMVPVDGGYTMAQAAMVETLEVLKARLILPMHYFGQSTLARFLSALDETFIVETHTGPEITVSPATLPRETTVLVLPGY